MKQNIIAIAITGLFTTGMLLYSCKKEQMPGIPPASPITQTTQTPGSEDRVSVNDGLLAFKSAEDYRAAADNMSAKEKSSFTDAVGRMSGFTPMSRLSANERTNSDYEDIDNDFLRGILNKDAAVQIGDYIYKISVKKGKVFVINKVDKNDYKDAVSGNANNKKVKVFSINDEVLTIMENKNTSRTGGNTNGTMIVEPCDPCGGGGGGGGGGPCYSCVIQSNQDKHMENITYEFKLGDVANKRVIDAKIKYERYGIYFTLYTRMDKEDNTDNTRTEYVLDAIGYYSIARTYTQSSLTYNQYRNNNTIAALKYKPYDGSKRLAFFYFKARYTISVSDYNGVSTMFPYTDWLELYVNI